MPDGADIAWSPCPTLAGPFSGISRLTTSAILLMRPTKTRKGNRPCACEPAPSPLLRAATNRHNPGRLAEGQLGQLDHQRLRVQAGRPRDHGRATHLAARGHADLRPLRFAV